MLALNDGQACYISNGKVKIIDSEEIVAVNSNEWFHKHLLLTYEGKVLRYDVNTGVVIPLVENKVVKQIITGLTCYFLTEEGVYKIEEPTEEPTEDVIVDNTGDLILDTSESMRSVHLSNDNPLYINMDGKPCVKRKIYEIDGEVIQVMPTIFCLTHYLILTNTGIVYAIGSKTIRKICENVTHITDGRNTFYFITKDLNLLKCSLRKKVIQITNIDAPDEVKTNIKILRGTEKRYLVLDEILYCWDGCMKLEKVILPFKPKEILTSIGTFSDYTLKPDIMYIESTNFELYMVIIKHVSMKICKLELPVGRYKLNQIPTIGRNRYSVTKKAN